MKVLTNFILLLVAWLLMKLVISVAFIYTTIKHLLRAFIFLDGRYLEELGDYYYACALTLDKSGSIIGSIIFNDWMVKPDGYRFSLKTTKTISYHLKKNSENDTWYRFGAFFGWLLNKIDKNHLEKSKE